MSLEKNVSKNLGKNIEKLRRKKNLSQGALAKLAELPRSTLTHIESGEGNPSLSNLIRVSSALGVGIEELLSQPRSECVLIPADHINLETRSQGRVRVFKLLPDKIRGLEMDRLEFEPGAVMGGHPHLQGSKEYLSVSQGQVVVQIGGERYTVEKGDVLAFPGNQAHSYRNEKKTVSIAFSVVIPGAAQIG